jgi:hypothetical protein
MLCHILVAFCVPISRKFAREESFTHPQKSMQAANSFDYAGLNRRHECRRSLETSFSQGMSRMVLTLTRLGR